MNLVFNLNKFKLFYIEIKISTFDVSFKLTGKEFAYTVSTS